MVSVRGVMAGLLLGGCLACGGGAKVDPPASTTAPVPHGDHNPKFGGVVLMNGNLHFEVVLDHGGRHRVYFSDEIRSPLPASTVSDVTIEVQRPGQDPERLALEIDERDESWVGQGKPVATAGSVARIGYSYRGQPYWIDLAFDLGLTAPGA